jgi:hypothetical protein
VSQEGGLVLGDGLAPRDVENEHIHVFLGVNESGSRRILWLYSSSEPGWENVGWAEDPSARRVGANGNRRDRNYQYREITIEQENPT